MLIRVFPDFRSGLSPFIPAPGIFSGLLRLGALLHWQVSAVIASVPWFARTPVIR
ncbi:hypothetical protein LPB67_13870 [Undibacterium sp. Jales W-56]|uniref:hypothetical protein n=1 Tax=Undibacterium sp. Jales W-56 TaxID=2897325 RepID=UPI0021D28686|nr:hypothetical protein [Undibacterium sp. Jales W-56]MCU6434859.1 hypothetical protein [Undibacterium sp. Jales W-56]